MKAVRHTDLQSVIHTRGYDGGSEPQLRCIATKAGSSCSSSSGRTSSSIGRQPKRSILACTLQGTHYEDWDGWYCLDIFGALLREHENERGGWKNYAKNAGDDNGSGASNRHNNKCHNKETQKLLLLPHWHVVFHPNIGLGGVWSSEHLGWNITWKQMLKKVQKWKHVQSIGTTAQGGHRLLDLLHAELLHFFHLCVHSFSDHFQYN